MGMTVFVAIIYVGATMIVKVLTRSLYAVMIPLALNIAELLRWDVPATWPLSVRLRRRGVWLTERETGSSKCNSECWDGESIRFHFDPTSMRLLHR